MNPKLQDQTNENNKSINTRIRSLFSFSSGVTSKIKSHEVLYVLLMAFLINFAFALFLLTWVKNSDLSNLPTEIVERFIMLFYFGISIFTTTGFGDISAKSKRMRLIVALYLILVVSGAISFFFEF